MSDRTIVAMPGDGIGKVVLDGAIKVLKEGGAIGIFPEGTRSKTGVMGKGKTGVARLAASTGAAVVPVAIRQTGDVWPISKRIPRPWRKFYYKFGDPIYFESSKVNSDTLREFTDEVMQNIAQLSKECEEYWKSNTVSARLRSWSENTRSGMRLRIESWRKNRKVSLLSRIRK